MAALSEAETLAMLDVSESESKLVYATADTFYSGALLEMSLSGGLVSPLGTGTGPVFFYGVCNKTKTFATSSGLQVSLNSSGPVIKGVNGAVSGVTVTGVTGDSDFGAVVYCSTDNIDDATLTLDNNAAAVSVAIGTVYHHVSSTACWIKLFTPRESMSQSTGTLNDVPIITQATGFTLVANDLNKLYSTRGATGSTTYTLPAVAASLTGKWAEFYNVADQEMVIAGTANELTTFNDATATSVTFTTASEHIGAAVRAVCDGTTWLIFLMTEETQSLTVT